MTEPDDFYLFRAETKGIKPIKQDTFVAPRQKSGQKKSHYVIFEKKKIRFSIFPMNMSPC